jgi:hypothetical protein
MEYISTTTLANIIDIPRDELFKELEKLGWIVRVKNKWVLTSLGEKKGGVLRKTQNGDEYISWPENLTIDEGHNASRNTKLLNATAIGKHFNVSSQRINLILSELGFQGNDIVGWELTKLGKSLGGKQLEYEQTGKSYILWPPAIVNNKSLIQLFNFNLPEKDSEPKINTGATQPETKYTAENFRHKYPASLRTQDGHFVRSKSELIIDNWLYISGLVHSYEKKLPIDEDVVSDFYIPSGNGRPQSVYIEYWGLEADSKYQERMKKKIEIYKKYEFPLVELTDKDVENIDDVLPRKLLHYKIKVSG